MQNWAMSICVAMIGGALFSMLVPNGNMKKVLTFTLNLFFISTIAAPILTGITQLDFSSNLKNIIQNDKLSEVSINQTIDLAKKNLETGLKAVFIQNGYKDVDINIDINKENETTEVCVKIPEDEQYSKKDIEQLVIGEMGIKPEIIY